MTAIPAKIAAFRAHGQDRYGVVTDQGIVDLTPEIGARFKGLQEVIAAGALEQVIAAAAGRVPTHNTADVTFLIPIAAPEKLICIGVNFPDRNEEYKDGQAAPGRPSMFIRFPLDAASVLCR